ncbi:MAG TPA: YraN family protein [Acidimicrobiia bacterium]|jgi:putative endonuclease|nr:YraN family protein [Acidimicrobiia bacterium]
MSTGARRSDPRRQLGNTGEDAAAAWYLARGYDVVDRNWRVREGEIDLIVRRASTLVFCEVKTRSSDRFGSPVEAVTSVKQRRLRKLAMLWLEAHRGTRCELRFDVASVTPGGDKPAVDVVENAF